MNYLNEYLVSLKNTVEFRELMDAKNKLKQNPKLQNMFLEFDNYFSKIAQSQMNENQKNKQLENLKHKYQPLLTNPIIANYIQKSEEFNKLFFDNSQKLLENLNNDIRL